jgi:hypothetical protein
MPLDRLWKIVNEKRDILAFIPHEILIMLASLAIEDFDMQPIPEMRGHLICLGQLTKSVRQRVAVD